MPEQTELLLSFVSEVRVCLKKKKYKMTSALTFKCGGEDPSKINAVQLFFLPSCSLCKETKGRLMIDVTEARRGGGGALASTERLNILMLTKGRG